METQIISKFHLGEANTQIQDHKSEFVFGQPVQLTKIVVLDKKEVIFDKHSNEQFMGLTFPKAKAEKLEIYAQDEREKAVQIIELNFVAKRVHAAN